MLSRKEATDLILEAKEAKSITYEQLAASVGQHPVWIAAAVYGQATMDDEQAAALTGALGLGPEVADALKRIPTKGALDTVIPVDPLMYRFHEITQVYGPAMKAVIHEKFGDGIMSAIDFEIDVQRQEDPKGDRVVVVFSGKFLPYRKW